MTRHPNPLRARLCFRGRLDPAVFADFAARRAALLAVGGDVVPAASRDYFECEVAGAPEMVDAFHMACWLGPPHAMIEAVDIERTTG